LPAAERPSESPWSHPPPLTRFPLSTDVPQKYAGDYGEACLVLSDSPKASAALSRRCLQLLLRDEAKVTHASLSAEIDQVLAAKMFPASIVEVDGRDMAIAFFRHD
jgi:hypothetical protein